MRTAHNVQGLPVGGPYAHAAEIDGLVYLSGQTPFDTSTGELVAGDISAEAEQCFANLFAVLDVAGLTRDDVIKVNVYLTDMAQFPLMNAVYETKFVAPLPARTTVAVLGLPLGARIEIEMVAKRS